MVSSSDGLILIPGGTFEMGSGTDRDHSPAHAVTLDPFYIDRCEVTNADYFAFCRSMGHRLPAFWGLDAFRSGPDYPDHPVVGVSWHDAIAYTGWRGARLPTEAEWEYAARGGVAGKAYPNGDEIDPADGNYARSGKGGPIPVGSYPANGFGLHDMLGSVVEWVWDRYAPDYYSSSPGVNPRGPETPVDRPEPVLFRVIRGGGWHSGPYCSRVYYRNALPANWLDFAVGFRCAKDAEPQGNRGG